MKQAENSERGMMMNMNNKRSLCGERVGAWTVRDQSPLFEVEQSYQALCNIASVGDL